MQLQTLILGLAAAKSGLAVPVNDSPQAYLANGLELPEKYSKNPKPNGPYRPDYRDPLDKAVDSIGDDLDPLPWRNGLGTSVLGPWNRERSRQSPDLVRPPTTDHGNMPNLRWSFADSHIRIEVSIRTTGVEWVTSAQNTNNREGGWVDPTDHTAGARR